jgi:uncharacterized membrane protein YfcA
MDSSKDNLEAIRLEKSSLQGRAYILFFEILGLLLAPAFLGVLVGNYFRLKYTTSSLLTFLLVTFLLGVSWIFIWKKYREYEKEAEDLDARYRNVKKHHGTH